MRHSCRTFTRAIPYACDISCECIARMQHSLATDLKSHAASLYLKLTTVRNKEYTMSENHRFCVQSDMQISQKPPTHCQKSPNSARLAFKLNIGNLARMRYFKPPRLPDENTGFSKRKTMRKYVAAIKSCAPLRRV